MFDLAKQKDKPQNCSAARDTRKRSTMHERREGGSERGRTLTAQRERVEGGKKVGRARLNVAFLVSIKRVDNVSKVGSTTVTLFLPAFNFASIPTYIHSH